jgi:hypothetical protein
MTDTDNLRLLEDALVIRRAQQRRAELALEQARLRAEALAERRDAQARLLVELQAAWRASMRGRSIDVAIATVWRTAIARAETELAFRDRDADDARQAHEVARGELAKALAQVDATDQLARSARRRLERSHEEAGLAAIDERNARAGGGR